MANETSLSTQLWKSYERLCDMEDAARNSTGYYDANWDARLAHARNEAIICQRLEALYGEPLLNAIVANNPDASMVQVETACKVAWDEIMKDNAEDAAMYSELRGG